MVNLSETLNDMIADPFDGPFEGEDFWVTEDGIIQVNNNDIGLAGKIMRKINQSGNFDKPLIKLGTSGDSIQLSFDTLGDTTPIFSAKIGFKGDMLAEIRQSENDKKEYLLYMNGKRNVKVYNSLARVKRAINKLDSEMKQAGLEPDAIDD
jgi:hypothetical protein